MSNTHPNPYRSRALRGWPPAFWLKTDGDVMFEALPADALHQCLHVGNLHHAVAAERIDVAVDEPAFAQVNADGAASYPAWRRGKRSSDRS